MADFDSSSKLIVALKRGASEYSIFGIEYDFGIVGGRSKLKSSIRSGTKIVSSGYSSMYYMEKFCEGAKLFLMFLENDTSGGYASAVLYRVGYSTPIKNYEMYGDSPERKIIDSIFYDFPLEVSENIVESSAFLQFVGEKNIPKENYPVFIFNRKSFNLTESSRVFGYRRDNTIKNGFGPKTDFLKRFFSEEGVSYWNIHFLSWNENFLCPDEAKFMLYDANKRKIAISETVCGGKQIRSFLEQWDKENPLNI